MRLDWVVHVDVGEAHASRWELAGKKLPDVMEARLKGRRRLHPLGRDGTALIVTGILAWLWSPRPRPPRSLATPSRGSRCPASPSCSPTSRPRWERRSKGARGGRS